MRGCHAISLRTGNSLKNKPGAALRRESCMKIAGNCAEIDWKMRRRHQRIREAPVQRPTESTFSFEGYTLDAASGSVRIGERVVELRPKSFDVLSCLL